MPKFLDPKVLTSFLNQYIEIRAREWNSAKGVLVSIYKDGKSIKTAECLGTNIKFYDEKKLANLSGWIELLYELGADGRKPSFLSQTLQAIRSYIIKKILDSDYYSQEFITYVNKLKLETIEMRKNIKQANKNKERRIDVAKKRSKYYENLLKLADLEDEDSVIKAAEKNLFGSLACPNLGEEWIQKLKPEVRILLNENIPFCYHQNYYWIYYGMYLRPKLEESFTDFERDAEMHGTTEIVTDNADTPKTDTSSSFLSNVKNATKNVTNFFSNITTTANKPQTDPSDIDKFSTDYKL